MPRRRTVKPVARLGCEDDIAPVARRKRATVAEPLDNGKKTRQDPVITSDSAGSHTDTEALMVKLLSSIEEVKQDMKLIKSRQSHLEENLSAAQESKKDSESDDEDDDPLEDAVHEVATSITGRRLVSAGTTLGLGISGAPTDPSHSGGSQSIPLGAKVSKTMKADIWADKYVELSQLMGSKHDRGMHLVCEFPTTEDESPVLKWAKKKSAPISSIGQWTKAFTTFAAVYTGKKPLEGQNLLKYIDTVRSIAEKNGDWATYDREFRQLKEDYPATYGWGTIIPDIYNEARLAYVVPNNLPGKGKETGGSVVDRQPFLEESSNKRPIWSSQQFFRDESKGKKPSWRFNRGQTCRPGCEYLHACQICGGDHKKRECSSTSGSTDTTIPAVPTAIAGKGRYSLGSVNGSRV